MRAMTDPSRKLSASLRTVVVVAADDLVRAFLVAALGAAGDVVEARDATSVLDLLARPGQGIDVVVGHSQHFDCVPLVRTVFRRWPWIPVVIVSGEKYTERLLADVLATGVRDILRPPVQAVDLIDSVRRVAPAPGRRVPAAPATIGNIKRILVFLGEHIGEIPKRGQLAAMASMSPSHFSHMFHAVTGMPLRNYLRDLRLKRAIELLVSPTVSLTVVAVESGFYDLPHCDKAFRHRFGMSPQRFRSLHGRPPET
jgi:AraC-like DNA-binding protein/CheY-like chemotaxis protein